MKNWTLITAAVALLATGGYWLTLQAGSAGASTASAANASGAGQNDTSAMSSNSTLATAGVAVDPPNNLNGQVFNPSANQLNTSGTLNPPLTRAVYPPQTLQIGDRKWTVLGTRDVTQDTGQKSILVLRDEISGQLDYRQSALRFVLQPGNNYEAFIRERRNAQRVFVNVLYGEIAVDAAYIAAEYTALASDKRVAKVQFMPLVVPAKPR